VPYTPQNLAGASPLTDVFQPTRLKTACFPRHVEPSWGDSSAMRTVAIGRYVDKRSMKEASDSAFLFANPARYMTPRRSVRCGGAVLFTTLLAWLLID
jgi:hypothetical protein